MNEQTVDRASGALVELTGRDYYYAKTVLRQTGATRASAAAIEELDSWISEMEALPQNCILPVWQIYQRQQAFESRHGSCLSVLFGFIHARSRVKESVKLVANAAIRQKKIDATTDTDTDAAIRALMQPHEKGYLPQGAHQLIEELALHLSQDDRWRDSASSEAVARAVWSLLQSQKETALYRFQAERGDGAAFLASQLPCFFAHLAQEINAICAFDCATIENLGIKAHTEWMRSLRAFQPLPNF